MFPSLAHITARIRLGILRIRTSYDWNTAPFIYHSLFKSLQIIHRTTPRSLINFVGWDLVLRLQNILDYDIIHQIDSVLQIVLVLKVSRLLNFFKLILVLQLSTKRRLFELAMTYSKHLIKIQYIEVFWLHLVMLMCFTL